MICVKKVTLNIESIITIQFLYNLVCHRFRRFAQI